MSTIYLVTGANRGIGYELVSVLAQRPGAVVYATARDPSSATALNDLAVKHSNLTVLKLEAASEEDNKALPAQIKEGHVDVVFANAGIARDMKTMRTQPLADFREHFEVNTLGPVMLYQAIRPLISKGGVFAVTSSVAGQIGVDAGLSFGSYGVSKAAANYVVARIGYEDKEIVTLAFHPGMVSTDMGKQAMADFGLEDPSIAVSPEASAAACVKLVDEAYESKQSATFRSYTGETMAW